MASDRPQEGSSNVSEDLKCKPCTSAIGLLAFNPDRYGPKMSLSGQMVCPLEQFERRDFILPPGVYTCKGVPYCFHVSKGDDKITCRGCGYSCKQKSWMTDVAGRKNYAYHLKQVFQGRGNTIPLSGCSALFLAPPRENRSMALKLPAETTTSSPILALASTTPPSEDSDVTRKSNSQDEPPAKRLRVGNFDYNKRIENLVNDVSMNSPPNGWIPCIEAIEKIVYSKKQPEHVHLQDRIMALEALVGSQT